jgi:hypothetical protein
MAISTAPLFGVGPTIGRDKAAAAGTEEREHTGLFSRIHDITVANRVDRTDVP